MDAVLRRQEATGGSGFSQIYIFKNSPMNELVGEQE